MHVDLEMREAVRGSPVRAPKNRHVQCRKATWRAIGAALLALASGAAPVLAGACGVDVRVGALIVDGGGTAMESGIDVAVVPDVDAAPPDAAQAVAQVTGLVLWLDGDRGISRPTASALTWLDQSGHGNHAIAPRAVPPSTSMGFNGHTGIAFDSTQLLTIADSVTLRFAADYTVLIVARSNTPASEYGALFGKPTGKFPFPGPGMYVNYPPLSGAPSSTVGVQIDFNNYIQSAEMGISDGVARIFEMQRTGTTLSVRVNSNAPIATTVPPTDVTSPGVDVFIGGHVTTSVVQSLTGAIAEILAVNATVSSSDYAAMHAYLSGKYAIP